MDARSRAGLTDQSWLVGTVRYSVVECVSAALITGCTNGFQCETGVLQPSGRS